MHGNSQFESNPDQEPFGGFQVTIKNVLLEIIGKCPFGQNPGQEPF